jgi:hypothetical protein
MSLRNIAQQNIILFLFGFAATFFHSLRLIVYGDAGADPGIIFGRRGVNDMNVPTSRAAARFAAAALLSVIIAGCQNQTDTIGSGSKPALSETGQARPTASGSDSPQKAYNKNASGGVPVVNAAAEEAKSGVEGAKMGSSSGKQEPAAPKKETKWDPKAPKLHGISLGESEQEALRKLGTPADSYSIDDGDGEVAVKEYDGFSVGFSSAGKVLFIEVFDKQAEADLNGLRIGDDVNAAIKSLGKPDTHTDSVLAYKAADALLKFDLDPESGKIISIKLFSQADQP